LTIIIPEDQDVMSIYENLLNGGSVEFNFHSQRNPATAGLSQEELAKRQTPIDVEFSTMKTEDDNSDILIRDFGLDDEVVLRIPLDLRPLLVDLLRTNPTCPISLDDLVIDGKVRPGVTALFQYLNNKPHVFLYDSETIIDWVKTNATNPLTRQAIHKKEFLELTKP
jgi:hypothetical protein